MVGAFMPRGMLAGIGRRVEPLDLDHLPPLGAAGDLAADRSTLMGVVTAEITQTGNVEQDIALPGQGRILRNDKAIALGGIEPLDVAGNRNGIFSFVLIVIIEQTHLSSPCHRNADIYYHNTDMSFWESQND